MGKEGGVGISEREEGISGREERGIWKGGGGYGEVKMGGNIGRGGRVGLPTP